MDRVVWSSNEEAKKRGFTVQHSCCIAKGVESKILLKRNETHAVMNINVLDAWL